MEIPPFSRRVYVTQNWWMLDDYVRWLEGIQIGLQVFDGMFCSVCLAIYLAVSSIWAKYENPPAWYILLEVCKDPSWLLGEPLSCVLGISPWSCGSNGLDNLNDGLFVGLLFTTSLVWRWDMLRLLGMVHPIREHDRVDSRGWNPRDGCRA